MWRCELDGVQRQISVVSRDSSALGVMLRSCVYVAHNAS